MDDLVFSGHDGGQVHADAGGAHAPASGIAGVVGDLGALDHGLGRRATRIDAGPTQVRFLNQRHAPTAIGEVLRKRITALA